MRNARRMLICNLRATQAFISLPMNTAFIVRIQKQWIPLYMYTKRECLDHTALIWTYVVRKLRGPIGCTSFDREVALCIICHILKRATYEPQHEKIDHLMCATRRLKPACTVHIKHCILGCPKCAQLKF